MDGGHAALDLRRVDHRPVGGPGTHHDKQVGPGQSLVGAVVAVGPDHAHVQGVVRGHNGQAHHGLDHWDLIALGQLQQLLLGVGQPHAAAGADEGLLGLGDGLGHPLDLQVVALYAGLIAPDVHFLRVLELLQLLVLNVDGDIDEHRSGPPGGGDVKGLLHDAGDVIGVFHQVAVLGEGGHRTGDVHLLEDIPAQQIAGHLPGNGHHGDGVHIGGGDAGDQIGRPRAGGDHTHPYLAGDAGIARGHVPGVLLGAHQGISDLRVLLQHVYNGADGGSGIAEDVVHLLPQKAFDQCLCSIHGNVTSVKSLSALLWDGPWAKKQKRPRPIPNLDRTKPSLRGTT